MTTPHARRLRATVGCLLAATLLISGCSSDDADKTDSSKGQDEQNLLEQAPVADDDALASSSTAQAIRDRGVLLNGTETGMPLLSQRNPATGQVTGFDATLAKMLAKYITGEPDVQQVNATGETRESLLQVGTVDVVVHAYTMTKEREEEVSFAGPYLTSGASIATLKDSDEGISGTDDLDGETVCAIESSSHIAPLKKEAPGADVTTVKTAPECVQKLESGDADAYVHDLSILAGEASLNNKLDVHDKTFTDEPYGIGIENGDQTFQKFINNWLKKIEKDGLWEKAWDRSFGTVLGDVPDPPKIGAPEDD